MTSINGSQPNIDNREAQSRLGAATQLRRAVVRLAAARTRAIAVLGAKDTAELDAGFFQPNRRGRP